MCLNSAGALANPVGLQVSRASMSLQNMGGGALHRTSTNSAIGNWSLLVTAHVERPLC
jgi:hypothetical protein